jgi:hypothetical protein
MSRSIRESPEFNHDWDVYRNWQVEAVTITEEQVGAIWHAITVVERVRRSEQCESMWRNPRPNLYKSRLLGGMLLDGKPPTRTKPPKQWGGPAWSLLPGGDPFSDAPTDPDHPDR